MNFAEELKKNPFYILKAAPQDTSAQLNTKMNEMLLFDANKDAEQAYLTLIHPQHRLEAEMGWFPGEKNTAADLIAYADSKETTAAPDVNSASTLGTVNALRTILEKWPVKEPYGAAALSICLLRALKDLRTETVFEELNRDRNVSRFPQIKQQETVAHHLTALQENTLKRLTERIGEMNLTDSLTAMEILAREYEGEGPLRKYYPLEELVQEHALTIQPEVEGAREELFERLGNDNISAISKIITAQGREFPRIRKAMEKWDSLTRPIRMIRHAKGVKDSDTVETEARVCKFVEYDFLVAQQKIKTNTLYQSINDFFREHHKDLVRWTLEIFFDLNEDKRAVYLERLNTM